MATPGARLVSLSRDDIRDGRGLTVNRGPAACTSGGAYTGSGGGSGSGDGPGGSDTGAGGSGSGRGPGGVGPGSGEGGKGSGRGAGGSGSIGGIVNDGLVMTAVYPPRGPAKRSGRRGAGARWSTMLAAIKDLVEQPGLSAAHVIIGGRVLDLGEHGVQRGDVHNLPDLLGDVGEGEPLVQVDRLVADLD